MKMHVFEIGLKLQVPFKEIENQNQQSPKDIIVKKYDHGYILFTMKTTNTY